MMMTVIIAKRLAVVVMLKVTTWTVSMSFR